MQDLLKIVKSLKDSGILLNGIIETVKNEVKQQKGGFLSMLLGTLGASLLGDLLTKNLSGRGVIRAGEGTIRAGYGYRIQNYDSIMCGYFCIGFIDYMFKGKSLTDYTNLFSPNNFKKNDDIILNYFLKKNFKKWLK